MKTDAAEPETDFYRLKELMWLSWHHWRPFIIRHIAHPGATKGFRQLFFFNQEVPFKNHDGMVKNPQTLPGKY